MAAAKALPAGAGLDTPVKSDGIHKNETRRAGRVIETITKKADCILTALVRFSLLSPLPIVLCATTALQATIAIVWGVLQ